MRIHTDAQKCVVFFGVAPPGGDVRYAGTGFFVGIREAGLYFTYLVTARHVAQGLEAAGDFFVRTNRLNGEAHSIPVHRAEWQYHPDPTVDVAAIKFSFDANICDVVCYDLRQTVKRDTISCGDEAYLVGLFRLHPGASRHTPLVHTGTIAAVADSRERIPINDKFTGQIILVDGHLVEAQTLEGLSGAPAFIRQSASLAGFDADGVMPIAFGSVRLFGLYQGSWDGQPLSVLAEDRKIDHRRVPVGMGIVVPGEMILELINDHPLLKKQRSEEIAAVSLPNYILDYGKGPRRSS